MRLPRLVPTPQTPSSGAPAPASAERRQLTVMFCDLVGSTALSTQVDPEDLRDLINAYHAACAERVVRFGGYLAKYMGDGVLAYFGYPQAHEDDPIRAIHAGLAILEAVAGLDPRAGFGPQVRIGIATGLVVVGDMIGEGAAREAMSLARRLTSRPAFRPSPTPARLSSRPKRAGSPAGFSNTAISARWRLRVLRKRCRLGR